jgi:hypothetical protein
MPDPKKDADPEQPDDEEPVEGGEADAGDEKGGKAAKTDLDLEKLSDEEIAALPAELQELATSLKRQFTKRTMALGEKERALTQREQIVGFAEDLAQLAQAEPAQARRIVGRLMEDLGLTEEPSKAAEPGLPAEKQRQLQEWWEELRQRDPLLCEILVSVVQQNATLQQRIVEIQQTAMSTAEKLGATEIETELANLKGSYGDVNEEQEEQILGLAAAMAEAKTPLPKGFTPLEAAFRAVLFPVAEKRGETRTRRRLDAKSELPDDEPSGRPAETARKPRDIREAFANAERTLNAAMARSSRLRRETQVEE